MAWHHHLRARCGNYEKAAESAKTSASMKAKKSEMKKVSKKAK